MQEFPGYSEIRKQIGNHQETMKRIRCWVGNLSSAGHALKSGPPQQKDAESGTTTFTVG